MSGAVRVRYSDTGLRSAMVGSAGIPALRYFESVRGTVVGEDRGAVAVLWDGCSRPQLLAPSSVVTL